MKEIASVVVVVVKDEEEEEECMLEGLGGQNRDKGQGV